MISKFCQYPTLIVILVIINVTLIINCETCLRRSGEYPRLVPPAESHVHVVAEEAVGGGGGVGNDHDGAGLCREGQSVHIARQIRQQFSLRASF